MSRSIFQFQIEKETKNNISIEKCEKCLHWTNWRKCRLGYRVNAYSKPCKHGFSLKILQPQNLRSVCNLEPGAIKSDNSEGRIR